MSYFRQTIKGLSWVGALRVFCRAITFLKTIIIARILVPFEFGVFGIVSLVLTFLEILTETGVNVILIQEKKITQNYLNSAWIVSILRGVLITILMILSREIVSLFFHTPEVSSLILLASIVPFLRGFINPAVIRFQKELDFEKEFKFRFLIFLVEAVFSIFLVLTIRTVTALVLGMIISVVFEVIFSFLWIKPVPALSFSRQYFSQLASRGKWVTLAGIFNYFFSQGDSLAVGRLLNTEFLGLYQMAYKIAVLPISEVADVVSKVTLPVYIKISEEKFRLKSAFIKTLYGMFFLVIPISFLFFFFPEEITSLILGKKWILIAPVLKILAVFVPLRAFSSMAITLFFSVKKQKYVASVTFFSFLFLLVSIIPLISAWGIVGAGVSVVISSALTVLLVIYFLNKIFQQQ